jgi:beta-glucanase (GH16 family)
VALGANRLMRRAVALVLASSFGCATSVGPGHTVPLGWTQVWSDEFDGAAGAPIDTTKWRYDLADGCPGNCGWGNSEKEYYTSASENVALNGQGHLRIAGRVAPAGLSCYYGACRYTSAKITTRGKMEASPGARVEARIKLAVGQGLWPAFWMLGRNIGTVGWPTSGEFDIMEHKGSDSLRTSSAVHGPGYSGNTPFVHVQPLAHGTIASDFHTYAVEWDSLHIRYFVDDRVHYVVARSEVEQYGHWVFDQPFFVILNLAVGGHFDGDPQSDAIFPATMLVDYVRVYKWEN